MYGVLEVLIKIVSFSFAMYGLWLLVGTSFLQSEIESVFRNWKRKRKIRRLQELSNVQEKEKDKSLIFRHIELVLDSISKNEKASVFNFVFLTVLIFLTSTVMLFTLLGDLFLSIIISISFALLPYLLIRFKLATLRLKTQFSFLQEYHNLIQNYQSTGRDVYYTILNVTKDTQDKDLKRIYMKLLSSLQKDRSNKEFQRSVTVFSYSINSTFAKRFSKLLIKAHMERADISFSMMDLNVDINKRKQDIQKEKTNKLETVFMGYLPIFLFPFMIFCAYRIASLRDFWFYFQQKATITIFVIALICSIISVLTAYMTSKPRADI